MTADSFSSGRQSAQGATEQSASVSDDASRPTVDAPVVVRPSDDLIRAARAVAFSNGFDAAYPEKLERLQTILSGLPLPPAAGVDSPDGAQR